MAARLGPLARLRRTRIYKSGVNNALPKRLNWEQIENKPRQEGREVVKGTTKRVIVVKSPNPKIFEQAIFIVRENYAPQQGFGPSEALREAQRVADDYIRGAVSGTRGFLSRLPPVAFAAAGALLAGLVWLALRLIGV